MAKLGITLFFKYLRNSKIGNFKFTRLVNCSFWYHEVIYPNSGIFADPESDLVE